MPMQISQVFMALDQQVHRQHIRIKFKLGSVGMMLRGKKLMVVQRRSWTVNQLIHQVRRAFLLSVS